MAISDVLFEAEQEIERYLAADPCGSYEAPELKAKIVRVVSAMRELRQELDTPPTPIEQTEIDEAERNRDEHLEGGGKLQ